jgi:hypothetical protein
MVRNTAFSKKLIEKILRKVSLESVVFFRFLIKFRESSNYFLYNLVLHMWNLLSFILKRFGDL